MMRPEEIREKILKALPNAQVEVQDTTGTMDHFQAIVISPVFQGKTMVEQHQLIYQALGESMREAIHALALKTYTPDQWRNL